MLRILFLLVIVGSTIKFSTNINAQNPIASEAKRVLYFSGGFFGLWATANGNYDRLLVIRKDKFLARGYLHLGYGSYSTWGSQGRITTLSLRWLCGQRNSHLEAGLGAAMIFDKQAYDIGVNNASGYEPKPSRWEYRDFVPAACLGYRLQKPDGGIIFRAGIASPDGVYISLGYAF